jgi:hypothetical protein
MITNKKLTMIAIIFTWCGLIIGISFLESWLKFKAPNVTLSIGLGIGKLVFEALNKLEWLLWTLFFILFISTKNKTSSMFLFFVITSITIICQTFWLFPALNERVTIIQSGLSPKPSNHHIFYIGFEIIKLIALINLGINTNKR